MTIEQYRNEYPFTKCLDDILSKVRKRKDLLIWRIPYISWEEKHFKDIVRIKNNEEPKLLISLRNDNFSSNYDYFIDGQKEELIVIAEELGIQPNSVIGSLYKNNDKILRKGLTITRVKKDEK